MENDVHAATKLCMNDTYENIVVVLRSEKISNVSFYFLAIRELYDLNSESYIKREWNDSMEETLKGSSIEIVRILAFLRLHTSYVVQIVKVVPFLG